MNDIPEDQKTYRSVYCPKSVLIAGQKLMACNRRDNVIELLNRERETTNNKNIIEDLESKLEQLNLAIRSYSLSPEFFNKIGWEVVYDEDYPRLAALEKGNLDFEYHFDYGSLLLGITHDKCYTVLDLKEPYTEEQLLATLRVFNL